MYVSPRISNAVEAPNTDEAKDHYLVEADWNQQISSNIGDIFGKFIMSFVKLDRVAPLIIDSQPTSSNTWSFTMQNQHRVVLPGQD